MSGKPYELLEGEGCWLISLPTAACFGRRPPIDRGHRAKASRMTTDTGSSPQRWREIAMFLVLAVVIWPFIAVAVVGGWGFLVWMWFAFIGLPGAPTGGH